MDEIFYSVSTAATRYIFFIEKRGKMFFWPWRRLSSIGEWVDHENSLLHAQNLKLIFCLKCWKSDPWKEKSDFWSWAYLWKRFYCSLMREVQYLKHYSSLFEVAKFQFCPILRGLQNSAKFLTNFRLSKFWILVKITFSK